MSDLPSGWAWTTLGEITDNLDRLRRPVSAAVRVTRAGSIPYYGATGQVGTINEALFDEELVLLGEDGVQFFDPFKPKAYVIHGKSWVNNHAHVLRATSLTTNRFLMHFLNHFNYAGFANGTTRLKLTKAAANSIPIPLPPVAEQVRIVDMLEDHFSRLDSAEATLCASRNKASALRSRAIESLLEAPVECGRAASIERLSDIAKQRNDRVTKRRQSATPPAYQLDLPDGWITASVDELCWQIQYGTSTKAGEADSASDVAVLRMGNIQDGEIDAANLKYIPADDPSIVDLMLEPGDLLFNRTNSAELVGKTAVFTDQLERATFASYLIRCRVVPEVSAHWVSYIANSSIGRRYIESVMTQQVGQANVNGTKLAAMPIPITSAAAERELLVQISELRQSGARLGNEIDGCLQRSAALRRAVLSKAFNGELVDQDPNDEPASLALQRLRAKQSDPRNRATRRTAGVATSDNDD